MRSIEVELDSRYVPGECATCITLSTGRSATIRKHQPHLTWLPRLPARFQSQRMRIRPSTTTTHDNRPHDCHSQASNWRDHSRAVHDGCSLSRYPARHMRITVFRSKVFRNFSAARFVLEIICRKAHATVIGAAELFDDLCYILIA